MTSSCVSELDHHCFRYWLVNYPAPSRYRHQCPFIVILKIKKTSTKLQAASTTATYFVPIRLMLENSFGILSAILQSLYCSILKIHIGSTGLFCSIGLCCVKQHVLFDTDQNSSTTCVHLQGHGTICRISMHMASMRMCMTIYVMYDHMFVNKRLWVSE